MEKKEEIYPKIKKERRLLAHVPDPLLVRKKTDRRGGIDYELGKRYQLDIPIKIYKEVDGEEEVFIEGFSEDLSDTGVLIKIRHEEVKYLDLEDELILEFKIPEGYMKESYDHRVKIKSKLVRYAEESSDGQTIGLGCMFSEPLNKYFLKRRWVPEITLASILVGIITLIIILMRKDSVTYFRFSPFLYAYSILTATYLLSRYVFGACYRPVRIDEEYTPGVSVIIPCFNEEEWIQKTIISCLNQDYPVDQLEVIVVDDCSNDQSVQRIQEIIKEINTKCARYQVEKRLKFIPLEANSGKRVALVRGVEVAQHELVTFVDSDSFLEPTAIRNLVQPFKDPKVGGVTGRTDVENAWTNYITKMQAVRYYIAFRILKAAEAIFDAVTCLSGPISCYRKDLIDTHKEAWLNQKFLGQPATFGDDRSMTNFILRTHRTAYQDTAICTTIVPCEFKVFLKQQMRWKRSWLRESLRAGSFMWRKEPFQALSFYAGFIVPILAPIVVLYNLVYTPLAYHVFPTVFITGILLMSFLMSFAYLLLRKSKIWIYGTWFCLFYECILIWQMPIACVTFWKSTWGTRKTKEDLEDEARRKEKKEKRKSKSRNKTFRNMKHSVEEKL